MANRTWRLPAGGLEIDVVELFGSITIGSTGAVSSSSGKGIGTVTRTSAGLYSIPLSDTYNAFLFANTVVLHSTDDDPSSTGVLCRIKSQAVTSTTAPLITIQFYNSTNGGAVDPVSGAIVYFMLKLRNSSIS